MAEQRPVVAAMNVTTTEAETVPEAGKLNRFFARARVLGVFLVGVALGALSLSVFAKEFSSPTSLRPSTLATTTEQFVALGSDGEPLVKTHVQATNYVKPAVTSKRTMNSTCVVRKTCTKNRSLTSHVYLLFLRAETTDTPNKADFRVEEKVVKPSLLSKLGAKNATTTTLSTTKAGTTSTSTSSSTSGTSGSSSKTTTKVRVRMRGTKGSPRLSASFRTLVLTPSKPYYLSRRRTRV